MTAARMLRVCLVETLPDEQATEGTASQRGSRIVGVRFVVASGRKRKEVEAQLGATRGDTDHGSGGCAPEADHRRHLRTRYSCCTKGGAQRER